MNLAAILLAAGGSARLGSPKQLLDYGARSLLRRAAETALAVPCQPVVVVLGARAETMRAELTGLDVISTENPAWERGMGSSIRWGMETLNQWTPPAEASSPDGVFLLLCDQPLVGPTALRSLVTAFQAAGAADTIAAAAYHGTTGVPALFGRAFFDELGTLSEAVGAKPLLHRHAAKVIAVPLAEAAVDVDTREQYERLPSPSIPGR